MQKEIDLSLKGKILTLRGFQVIIDRDLAELYEISTKRLNEQVKRNLERFPEDFMFQVTKEEKRELVAKCDHLKNLIFSNSLPYVFTEQGVVCLSGILRSRKAINVNIQLIRTFVAMRNFLSNNADIFAKIDFVERKQLEYQRMTDKNFEKVFDALENKDFSRKQGIFYDGQIFDAYQFVSEIIRKADKSIVLIDNYVDDSVLTLFSKRKKGVECTIYSNNLSERLLLDLKKFNSQYEPISITKFSNSHDRFMIIDKKTIYHVGASLKNLGKKWFAFSKFDIEATQMLNKLL